jgi:hypothetical protein
MGNNEDLLVKTSYVEPQVRNQNHAALRHWLHQNDAAPCRSDSSVTFC